MAAEQTTGRRCGDCGCDISHRSGIAVRCVTCSYERHREQKRARNAGYKQRAEARRSLAPMSNVVRSQHDPIKRAANKVCAVCFGMPWARRARRFCESGPGIDGVADASGRCKGCGELYAPEPPPDRMSVLGSSAGVAAAQGRLYGTGYVLGKGAPERKGSK